MKKAFLALALACLSFCADGQYLIQPVAPPPQFGFSDLWHFTATRSLADKNTRFYVSLRIFDGNNGLKVKSNSAIFLLPTGTSYYNRSNLSPLQPFANSFTDAGVLQQAIATGGLFPAGTYVLVYTLYGKGEDGDFAPLAEESLTLTVESLWPPMLLWPSDGDTVPTAYPMLTWSPAFSSSLTGSIEYRLRLVELFNGQNAYQAIQANPAYFTQSGLPVTTLPYPAAAQALDTGKVYAWQVHADAGGTSLGSSEVWTFRLATPKNETEKPLPQVVYFDIKRSTPFEAYRISDGFLYLRYEEEYAAENAELKFEVLDKNLKPRSQNLRIPLSKGVNRIHIDQCKLNLGKINAGEPFYFKVSNAKGETFSLKFFPKTDHNCR